MLVVGSLYLFVNVAYYYAMSPLEIASVPTNSSVATEVLKRFLGPIAVSMTAVALHDFLIRFAARERAREFSRSLRDGARRTILSRPGPPFASFKRARAGNRRAGRVGQRTRAVGSYDTLTDSVVFASWLFYGLSTGSLFIFRRTMPDAPRPYRALGYPVVPVIFLAVTAALLINTFVASPHEALRGVAVLIAGLPLYWYWVAKKPEFLTGSGRRAG